MIKDSSAQVIKRIDSKIVYQNPWMTVREDRIERPDGSSGIYGVVDKPDFALVIPAEAGGFHMVEEYRYPIRRRTWSFPQGTFPMGEDGSPTELALSELAQETGLRAKSLQRLGFLHCSHGTSGQGFNVFLASDLSQGETDRELEEQDMDQAWFSRAEFHQMIRDGRITDDSTLAAYSLLLMFEAEHEDRPPNAAV
ncbi:NUDIX hydrolase [Actinocorallia sp. API 0066]|uniref:NUDIX domain-containing protein n=1 Tax=Actinocorallia sp. API 0066 TaxID=2896846 RepID=UPI001E53FE76|nr:NUDIX hydrolase [Actinocorallia sp. API 0066]MCD0453462.1 NUDIX hydrolase [Actinocorallia sp. API 0066]